VSTGQGKAIGTPVDYGALSVYTHCRHQSVHSLVRVLSRAIPSPSRIAHYSRVLPSPTDYSPVFPFPVYPYILCLLFGS